MIPLKDDNPTRTFPYVTYGIIGVNVVVFVYMLFMGPGRGERFVLQYSLIPATLVGGESRVVSGVATSGWFSLFSSMFLHGGFLHIAGNMLFLWIFGDNIEDYLGHAKYLFFYLACGVLAALSHAFLNPDSTLPMLGASGAISGVLGAYIILYPRAGVWTFFFFLFFWQVIKVPAVLIIGLWIFIQVVNGLLEPGQQGGGVAWFAHVGGFVAGMLFILIARPFRRYG
jgi:membrane associated rhomboid family serine protease